MDTVEARHEREELRKVELRALTYLAIDLKIPKRTQNALII
jgi:hypothetical protein